MKRTFSIRFLMLRKNTWYFKKVVNGKPMQVSLATDNIELAKVKRDQILKQLDNAQIEQIRGPRTKPGTVGEVIQAYSEGIQRLADRIEPETVASNANALRSLYRWALGENGQRNLTVNVDQLSTDTLTPAIVAKFKENYLASAGANRELLESRRRGAASLLRHVRSVLAEKSMPLFRELILPDMEAFRGACQLRFEQRVHLPIGTDVLAEMYQAMDKIKDTEPELWLVHFLHKVSGLRNDELCQARVEWFNRAPWGQLYVSVLTRPYFEPKGSSGHVPLHSSAAALLAPLMKDRKPDDFVIAPNASMTAREELVNRTHAEWIRKFLPKEKFAKAGYELRRWAAQKMEEKYGRDAAEAFLRHSPKTVAERHYFERWYPWRRLGDDVGITTAETIGQTTAEPLGIWANGASAFSAPPATPQETSKVA